MSHGKYKAQCYHLNTWRMTREGDCYQWLEVDGGCLVPVDDFMISPSIPLGSCEIGQRSTLNLLAANPPSRRWSEADNPNRDLQIPLDGIYHAFYRQWDHLLIVPSPDPDIFDSPHWEDDLVRGGEGVSPRADIREWQKNKKKMKEWFKNDGE